MAKLKDLLSHLLIILAICNTTYLSAQDDSSKYASTEDTSSLDNILTTLYAVISGEKGEERNWDQVYQFLQFGCRSWRGESS